jgi:formylglycine-generating enzyme required for sulfatase activity
MKKLFMTGAVVLSLVLDKGWGEKNASVFVRINASGATAITDVDSSRLVTWSNEFADVVCSFETATLLGSPTEWHARFQCLVTGTVMSARLLSRANTTNMCYIPAGTFDMGDGFGDGNADELPVHVVGTGDFFIDRDVVTKTNWDTVYEWAISHGYDFYGDGNTPVGQGKADDHPVQTVNWYDCVKWCNARSEMEGRAPAYYTSADRSTVYRTGAVNIASDWVAWRAGGYRLPTEAEWEKAARGGHAGHRFPWHDRDTISWSNANYYSSGGIAYDANPIAGYHPQFQTGFEPYTSPAGSFMPNRYGLDDMAGNVQQWCWDWQGGYPSSSTNDPRGPQTGVARISRGGAWNDSATGCRVSARNFSQPSLCSYAWGFRTVLSEDPPPPPSEE